MPLDQTAAIEITAFSWVPDFAKGNVRDMRVRWALEEAGLAYRVRLFDAKDERPEGYLREQPFGQVPCYRDGEIAMFESIAIALQIAEGSEALMPTDPAGRIRARTWAIAAINSVENTVDGLIDIDIFHAGKDWAKARRPEAEQAVRRKLTLLSGWLGEKEHLEDRFTVGDLAMASVLRALRHTELVAEHQNLKAYLARCEARPAFQKALADHMAAFERPAEAA
jgi:glutathione S-transferase